MVVAPTQFSGLTLGLSGLIIAAMKAKSGSDKVD